MQDDSAASYASDEREKEFPTVRPFRLIRREPSDREVLSSLVSGSVAQIVIAIAAVLAVCYFGKLPLITLFLAILIAFVLAPIADWFERWRLPRWASSFIALFLLSAALYSLAFVSYNKAISFVEDLPKYSKKISQATTRFRSQAEKIQQSTQAVFPKSSAAAYTVTVKQQSDISTWLMSSFDGITELFLSLAFIPFLTYFMLTWRERTWAATVKLFDPKYQHKVHVMLGGIAGMLKAFLVGNLVCGLFMSAVSMAVFGFLKLPYSYFLGLISGFLSLVPYLGVVLSILPPLLVGLDLLDGAQIAGIGVMVVGLHVFTINILFPKVIGRRLKLNPLVVTIALLICGCTWGAGGLILAIPITGAMKII